MADVAILRLGLTYITRQVRTSHDAQLDVPINNQRKTHRILTTTKEAFGAINRIKGPEARVATAFECTLINTRENVIVRKWLLDIA